MTGDRYSSDFGLTYFQTFLSEMESFATLASDEVSAERRSLGAMPFIVLTRGDLSPDMPAGQAATEWKLCEVVARTRVQRTPFHK